MDQRVRQILVPYDYSEKSDFAVKHAVQMAKIIEAQIILLHIIEDLSTEDAETKRLQKVADAVVNKYGVSIKVQINQGKVHRVIKEVAQILKVNLVIMKTQEPIGRERFLGSRSIRVMMGSQIPFLVIQEPPKRLGFRRVVFPIDFRKENKEKLRWISFLSKYYTSKIYLFRPNAHDYKVRNNLDFAIRFLEGKDIDYEIIKGKSKFNLSKDAIEFAHEINAEMIVIMLSKKITYAQLIFGLKDQQYISNKYNVPILCLNPRTDLRRLEGFN